jgi:late competence protein required for DNA uptake (superfamily II DNA/RNA helicase)
MIVVDLFCKECDKEHIDVFVDMKLPMPKCPDCNIEMTRMVAKRVSFELKYDNRKDVCDWHGNSSCYWNKIKETGGEEPSNNKQAKWL